MRNQHAVVVTGVTSLLLASTCDASLIRSQPFSLSTGFGTDATLHPITTGFGVHLPGTSPFVFSDLSLRPSDTGRTFTATAANYPDFDALAAGLTDGVNQSLELRLYTLSVQSNANIGVSILPTESQFFWTSNSFPIDLSGPANGLSINRIDVRLTLVRQEFINGITFMDLAGSLNFYVPAPGSALSLLGLFLVTSTRRRRTSPR